MGIAKATENYLCHSISSLHYSSTLQHFEFDKMTYGVYFTAVHVPSQLAGICRRPLPWPPSGVGTFAAGR